jgi:hypothetical protein
MRFFVFALVLSLAGVVSAQEDYTRESRRAGFEAIRLDLSTALVYSTAETSLDVSAYRTKVFMFGARVIGMTHGWTMDIMGSGEQEPAQYGAGLLALYSHKEDDTRLDLTAGPVYLVRDRTDPKGWRLHFAADYRIFFERNIAAVLFHASTESAGVGISIGWARP